jgi:hypothetical protein
VKTKPKSDPRTQAEKFEQAARDHGADEDEKHWEERLKKLAKQKVHKPR